MNEVWKAVVGYEGIYEVSSHGRIRKQTNEGWKQINPYGVSGGYVAVSLYKFKKKTQTAVHIIVAQAFIGPIPKKMLVHHKDTCKTNNHKDNLEIVTTRFNTQHACDAGLIKHAKGERHGRAKLTEAEVISLKNLHKQGISIANTARAYNISYNHASDIVNGRKWKHLT